VVKKKLFVIDTKVIECITDQERGKTLNRLRVTKLRIGVMLNFRHANLEREWLKAFS